MRLPLLLLSIFLIIILKANATHIVGGEFELQYLQGNTYKLNMNLYFDNINGDPLAQDPFAAVRIFEKNTNRLMLELTLPYASETMVNYTNIECTTGELSTKKIIYASNIILEPYRYTSEDGYYVVWERCCRNRTINNIIRPEDAAQAFYMEFPAVTKNGAFFKNSSPTLFPPLSDYACVNELFYYDFAGSDADGDSLVYDMVTPLNGHASIAIDNRAPLPSPAPYSEIMWQTGYSRENQINGTPSIRIDEQTGLLIMRPANKGLYIFGVRCQEFRNGKKIGEIRRDFQVLVKECPTNESPVVMAKAQGSSEFYKPGDILRLKGGTERCINVLFTDPDRNESLILTARPVNFVNQDYTINGTTSGAVNTGITLDSLKATICFSECFDTEGKVYQMDLIVKDDGCSLPRQDTVRVSFVIEPEPDAPPMLSLSTPDRIFTVGEGAILTFDVTGTDPDQQEISLSLLNSGDAAGYTFENQTGIGPLTSTFSWPIDCEVLKKESYLLEFVVSSTVCGQQVTKTETAEVRTISKNNPPTLTTDKPALTFELALNETFEAKLFGDDIDLNKLSLQSAGEGFNLAELGMTFTSTGGNGKAEGLFSWVANCAAVEKGVVKVDFILTEDACAPSTDRKLTMEFKVKAPEISDYIPANIFTPNGDGLNDYFEIPGLPSDFCTTTFRNIRIYNRWGKEVYRSDQNNFKWDGKNVNDGVYFYVIDFGASEYKGAVTLVH
ncbi:gliding motility-associated C-terminal domain-containing protein [Pontibacter vulgaris]|uniref:gliding motility-associated C-terminal domain-containing protein n=1 Tax=Pontibacter vulgaris TaxID=2905679 RepID=UPI001FA6B7EF|nr:gliding motility-associated C-terminal domain-containing protein [Pontibacter vulgaris]